MNKWKCLYTVQYCSPIQRNERLTHARSAAPHRYREKPVSEGYAIGFHSYNNLKKTSRREGGHTRSRGGRRECRGGAWDRILGCGPVL